MINERVQIVEANIRAACKKTGRNREEITLIAVTKRIDESIINEAISLGIDQIGENKVQEYLRKKSQLQPHAFHLIGHLQTNKVKQIIHDVAMIHSVDSIHLAEEISTRAKAIERVIPILLEVNTSAEESKYGIQPNDLLPMIPQIRRLENVNLLGLMTLAAYEEDAEKVRPSFVMLRKMKEAIEMNYHCALPHLSMGMSNDYPVAIEEGATMIRIGTAIFGARS